MSSSLLDCVVVLIVDAVQLMTDLSIPGSGKSTLAYPLTDRLNAILLHRPTPHPAHVDAEAALASPDSEAGARDEIAICVGLDGWHFSREKLDGFDDPKEAHWRRVSRVPSQHRVSSRECRPC